MQVGAGGRAGGQQRGMVTVQLVSYLLGMRTRRLHFEQPTAVEVSRTEQLHQGPGRGHGWAVGLWNGCNLVSTSSEH